MVSASRWLKINLARKFEKAVILNRANKTEQTSCKKVPQFGFESNNDEQKERNKNTTGIYAHEWSNSKGRSIICFAKAN